MAKHRFLFGVMASLATAVPACAQDNATPAEVRNEFNAVVPPLCVLGTSDAGDAQFALGTMIDTSTGLLRSDMAAASQRLISSFCNSPSQLRIEATEMRGLSASGTPRAGFSDRVHYTATASGWADLPATYRTDQAAVQPEAVRFRSGPRQSDIVIAVGDFRMEDGDRARPIASRRYEGTITVTLGPAS